MLMPDETVRERSPHTNGMMMHVQAYSGQIDKARGQTEAILRNRRGLKYNEPDDFDLQTSQRLIQEFDSITAYIGLFVIGLSGVGLLVGGIGVMNIMLVSVTERTREI